MYFSTVEGWKVKIRMKASLASVMSEMENIIFQDFLNCCAVLKTNSFLQISSSDTHNKLFDIIPVQTPLPVFPAKNVFLCYPREKFPRSLPRDINCRSFLARL